MIGPQRLGKQDEHVQRNLHHKGFAHFEPSELLIHKNLSLSLSSGAGRPVVSFSEPYHFSRGLFGAYKCR